VAVSYHISYDTRGLRDGTAFRKLLWVVVVSYHISYDTRGPHDGTASRKVLEAVEAEDGSHDSHLRLPARS